jgi:hypothetical protein
VLSKTVRFACHGPHARQLFECRYARGRFLKLGTTLVDAALDDAGEHEASLARRLGVVRNSLVSYRDTISPGVSAVSFKWK